VSDPAASPRRCGAVFADAPASFTGPFASLAHCQLLIPPLHTTHFALPPRTGDTRAAIWWSGSVFVIVSSYKRPYEYASGTFPPDDWIIANFVNTPDCAGGAPGKCDDCDLCSLFTDWRREKGVAPFDNFDLPSLSPMEISDEDRERLGEPICGLCGGRVE
jgi:hypothetical protein